MAEPSARITISRTSSADVQNRQVYVMLDGAPVATLLYGREVTRDVEPGTHVLVANNTLRKKKLEFTIAPGGYARFQVASIPGWGYNYLVGLFGAAPMRVSVERMD
jgi:hypothetical protein